MGRNESDLEKLSELLASGRFPPNSRLPPERELAPSLGMSRRALREGLEVLEAQGRIWRHVGKGTFISSKNSAEAKHLQAISALTSPAEVLEIRLLIEPLVARLAATRATAPEIDEMKYLLDKGSKVGHPAVWEACDISLHRVVAQASHNALLLTIFDLFNEMRKQPTWGALRSASLTSERVKSYDLHHRAFVAAIAHRDPAEAEEAMRVHIQNVRDNLLNVSTARRKNPALEGLPPESSQPE